MTGHPSGEPSTSWPKRFRGLEWECVLGLEVPVASTRSSRLLGLSMLGRLVAPPGLLLPRCRSIHTFGMRFSLDLVFLDRGGSVAEVIEGLPAGRFASCRRADAVLELVAPSASAIGFDGAGTDLAAPVTHPRALGHAGVRRAPSAPPRHSSIPDRTYERDHVGGAIRLAGVNGAIGTTITEPTGANNA